MSQVAMTAATECGFEILENQENAFYFEGIRKLQQRWAKCIALKGENIEK